MRITIEPVGAGELHTCTVRTHTGASDLACTGSLVVVIAALQAYLNAMLTGRTRRG